jgi:hypothetical protein
MSGDHVVGHVLNTWADAGGTPVLQLSPLGVLPERGDERDLVPPPEARLPQGQVQYSAPFRR